MISAKQEDVANNFDRAAKDLGPKVIKTLLVNEGGQLYLSTDKLRRWLQSLVNKSLPKIQLPNGKVEKVGTKWIFLCPTYNRGTIQFQYSNSGPASTLKIVIRDRMGKHTPVDMDLVPVFKFSTKALQNVARVDVAPGVSNILPSK